MNLLYDIYQLSLLNCVHVVVQALDLSVDLSAASAAAEE